MNTTAENLQAALNLHSHKNCNSLVGLPRCKIACRLASIPTSSWSLFCCVCRRRTDGEQAAKRRLPLAFAYSRRTLGQNSNINFRKFKSFDFYHFGDFGQKLVKIVKILKDFISGKVYSRLAPVWASSVCFNLTDTYPSLMLLKKLFLSTKRMRLH